MSDNPLEQTQMEEIISLRAELEAAKADNARLAAAHNKAYETVLLECDAKCKECDKVGDLYGVNFYQGKRSGAVAIDIEVTSRVSTALRDLLGKTVELTTRAIAVLGPASRLYKNAALSALKVDCEREDTRLRAVIRFEKGR